MIDVVDGVAKVKLIGSCAACPFAELTLKMRVEKIIKDRVPEITEVVNVE